MVDRLRWMIEGANEHPSPGRRDLDPEQLEFSRVPRHDALGGLIRFTHVNSDPARSPALAIAPYRRITNSVLVLFVMS